MIRIPVHAVITNNQSLIEGGRGKEMTNISVNTIINDQCIYVV